MDGFITDFTPVTETGTNMTERDIPRLAMSYITYKIGEGINKSYFPILVPVGIVGNILSFLVMVQPHNRHMSISLYISVLAVADTVALILGFTTYLSMVHHVYMPPNQYWFCTLNSIILFSSMLCSTLLIISMTFDRFYSIIRPHKAASYNTVKRAKITIACIVLFSFMFNIPHLFITSHDGARCLPYGSNMQYLHTQFYYWVSFTINFALPFVLLLIMNCVIIYTLRNRTVKNVHQGQGQGHGQGQKVKSSESQIYVILLLVTFAFLILTTPAYIVFLYIMFVDFHRSPNDFAGFYLFYNVAQKAHFTNHGINFFLYVISGGKFRADLIKLFKCKSKRKEEHYARSDITSPTSMTEVSALA